MSEPRTAAYPPPALRRVLADKLSITRNNSKRSMISKVILLACLSLFGAIAIAAPLAAHGGSNNRLPVTARGAVGDGVTLNTKAIQAAIDGVAATGGGTVVFPPGEFLSGALFLKPGVNVELLAGAILKGSSNFVDYPTLTNARFEGHFEDRVAALLNVAKSDHFRLTGPGLIDGNGAAYWKMPSPLGRPRLCAIRDSRDVVVSGVCFSNSPTWNLHLYNCRRTIVKDCRFEITPGSAGPSTDGIDIDSSQYILVTGCYFSVNDDCVCLKGNRYDGLNQQPASPPVRNVRVQNCTFARGMGALTLGTEAQGIRNAELKNSVVRGRMPLLRIKFRPDTANQDYRHVRVSNIQLEGNAGTIVGVEPGHGTKVPSPKAPISHASGISLQNISGTFGSFGSLSGGAIATMSDITLRNIHVTVARNAELNTNGVVGLKIEDVVVQMK